MTSRFDYFVLLAGMRTGSNFLESNLNALDGIECFGEAFNPHFIGYPKRSDLLGITRDARDTKPAVLVDAIRTIPQGLGGFRLFHDHDPRVLDHVLADESCAKIVLTRNPLDSYVSWKIAQSTGQWKLTDVKRQKSAKAVFHADEFLSHAQTAWSFQSRIRHSLQASGQSAFFLSYDDLHDLDVLNGLARWLGSPGRLDKLDRSLKPQNPVPVTDKVTNSEEMTQALAEIDLFNLSHSPDFEAGRGPAVPSYVTSSAGLLFLPIPGGPVDAPGRWMARLEAAIGPENTPKTGLTQKTLRQWKRQHPGHRSFTVLRHPVARAHAVFCQRILSTGSGAFLRIRASINRQFNLNLPDRVDDARYTESAHYRAFLGYLDFVAASLAGQTGIRSDGAWATQATVLAGFAQVASPDFILREDEMKEMLPVLGRCIGVDTVPDWAEEPDDTPHSLERIYDDRIEKRVSEVYQRDYLMFGFSTWRPDQAA